MSTIWVKGQGSCKGLVMAKRRGAKCVTDRGGAETIKRHARLSGVRHRGSINAYAYMTHMKPVHERHQGSSTGKAVALLYRAVAGRALLTATPLPKQAVPTLSLELAPVRGLRPFLPKPCLHLELTASCLRHSVLSDFISYLLLSV